MTHRSTLPLVLPFATALAIPLVAGCAPSNGGGGGEHTFDAGSGGAGGSAGGGAGGGAGSAGLAGLDSGLGDSKIDPDAACAAVSEQATSTPLDLYIMFDKSSSMNPGKWPAAKAGLDAFLNDPQSAGVRVAINFFPRPVDSVPACDPSGYQTPKVAYGALPGNAAAIMAAVDAETPDGFSTPIYPALAGALAEGIAVAKTAKNANQPESSAVLLVTDGVPQGPSSCSGGVNPEDPAAIAQLAANGAAYDPAVLTFVVGLPGVDQGIANQIAAAGGTQQAIVVVDPTNVQSEFQSALAKVRGEALPCEFFIPQKVADKTIAPNLVNVVWTHGDTQQEETLPQTSDCASGGWRYDDPQNPTKIELCPATCDAIKGDYQAKIDIALGCATVVK